MKENHKEARSSRKQGQCDRENVREVMGGEEIGRKVGEMEKREKSPFFFFKIKITAEWASGTQCKICQSQRMRDRYAFR